MSEDLQLFALLHDASEAYICDMPSPAKQFMPEYKIIEKKLQNIIYLKFCGRLPTDEEETIIKYIDTGVLMVEGECLMNNISSWANATEDFKNICVINKVDSDLIESIILEVVKKSC